MKLKDFCLVMNTAEYPKSGHWIAVKVSPKILEYFNPFGERPSQRFLEAIYKIMKKDVYQHKINLVKHQMDDSSLCGLHCIKFLLSRYLGKTFKETTGFDKIDKSKKYEKELIEDFKNIKGKGFEDLIEPIADFGNNLLTSIIGTPELQQQRTAARIDRRKAKMDAKNARRKK